MTAAPHVMTEAQLKRHLPVLCERLNKEMLFHSLSCHLGDHDIESLLKHLNSPLLDRTINKNIYLTLKRAVGRDHVSCFLRAAQDQFPDLTALGIHYNPPRTEATSQLPSPHQPDGARGSSRPPVLQQCDTERTGGGHVTQKPPQTARVSEPPGHHPPSPAPRGSGPPHPLHPSHSPSNDPTDFGQHSSMNHGHLPPYKSSMVKACPQSTNPDQLSYYHPVPFSHPSAMDGSCSKNTGEADFRSCEDRSALQPVGWDRGTQRPLNSSGTGLGPISHPSVPRAGQRQVLSDITKEELLANLLLAPNPQLLHLLSSVQRMRDAVIHAPSSSRQDDTSSTASAYVGSGHQSVPASVMTDNSANPVCHRVNASLPQNILTSVEDNAAAGMTKQGPSSRAVGPPDFSNPPSAHQYGDLFSLEGRLSYVQTDGDLSAEDVQPEQPEGMMGNSDEDQGARNNQQRTNPQVNPTEKNATIVNYYFGKVVINGDGNHMGFGQENNFYTKNRPLGQQNQHMALPTQDEFPVLSEAAEHVEEHLDDTLTNQPTIPDNPQRHQIPLNQECSAHLQEQSYESAVSAFCQADQHHDTQLKDRWRQQAEEDHPVSHRAEGLGSAKSANEDLVAVGQETQRPTRSSSSLSQLPDPFGDEQNAARQPLGYSKPGVLLGPEELQRFEEQSIELPAGIRMT